MECSKGWKRRCAEARGARCRCRCGGANHGKAWQSAQVHEENRKQESERLPLPLLT
jgi:hypothetical protein